MIPVEYEVGNFKAVGAVQTLDLNPVTLIFGKNSAGKSSIIQSLLLCQRALLTGSFDFGAVPRWGQMVDLGDFRQYVHRHNVEADVTFGFTFDRTENERTTSAHDSQVERALLSQVGNSEPLWSFCFFNDVKSVSARFRVGRLRDDPQPQIKTLTIDLEKQSFLNFERDDSGRLALTNVQLDHTAAIFAFAAFANRFGKFEGKEEEEVEEGDEATYIILKSLLEQVGGRISSAPNDLVARVEEVYHTIQSELGSHEMYLRVLKEGAMPPLSAEGELIQRKDIIRDVLAQSELFAAYAFEFGAKVRELMKEVRLDTKGFRVRQNEGRLSAHRDEFNRQAMLKEQIDAIEDPIGFFLSEGGPEEVPAGLAKAFRFDVELLLDGVFESLDYWLRSTEYVGPFRSIPSRLSVSSASSSSESHEEGATAMRLLTLDPLVFDKVSSLLDKTLQAPYTLSVRKTAPAVDQSKLQEAIQRAVERHADAGATETSAVVAKTFRDVLEGRTSRGLYLVDNRNATEVDFADVGFGIGQVLPLLIEVAKDRSGIVCIEQPEVHIHPKMQADLGDVFIDRLRTASRRTLLILETHSEHIILRLLRRVRETTEWLSATTEIGLQPTHIRSDELAVHWIEMINGEARITILEVTPEGDFEQNWPEGFFEERIQELPL
jgi:hypothetical protein